MEKSLDFIFFGATGFTGEYCIRSLVKCLAVEKKEMKWGVAGRSESKMTDIMRKISTELSVNLDSIPVIVADVNDSQSLESMCRMCKVLINCVGPYKLYGERVLLACIKSKTHQVDVTGESAYMEQMQLKHYKEAEEAGVYIVNACGIESIVCETGVAFLKQQFEPNSLKSVETYVNFSQFRGSLNVGTWFSVIELLADFRAAFKSRKDVYEKFYPKRFSDTNTLKCIPLPHRSSVVGKICIPIPEPDQAVANRTQAFNYNYFGENPVQIESYIVVGSICHLFVFLCLILTLGLLGFCEFGRNLLRKFPEIFSFGIITKGPTEENIRTSNIGMTLVGKGWHKENEKDITSPDKSVVAVVDGPSVYVTTAICVIQSAITILEESQSFKVSGGVFTPGVVFENLLVERLQRHGIHFKVVKNN